MPLLNCPDCGRRVSHAAAACPQCGRPASLGFHQPPVVVRHCLGVHPWRRLLARFIDHLIAGFAFAVIALFGDPSSLAEEGVWLSIFWAGMFLWIPAEALWLARRGRTPGKALLGLAVRKQDGRLLSFREALSRSVQVWFYGLAAGLPLLSILAPAVAYRRLKETGATSWDRKIGALIEYRVIGLRQVAASVAALFVIALLGGGTAAAAERRVNSRFDKALASALMTSPAPVAPQQWPDIPLPRYGGATASLKTVCRDYTLRYQLRIRNADVVLDRLRSSMHLERVFILSFLDRDGFELFNTPISYSQLSTSREADGSMSLMSNGIASGSCYDSPTGLHAWQLGTRIDEPASGARPSQTADLEWSQFLDRRDEMVRRMRANMDGPIREASGSNR